MPDASTSAPLPARLARTGRLARHRHSARRGHIELLARALPLLYLAVALLVTSLVCVLSAPFFGPDEPDQSSRALELSHARLLAHFGTDEDGNQQAGDEIDGNAIRAMGAMDAIRMAWEKRNPDFHNRSYGPVSLTDQAPLNAIRWSRQRTFLPFQNTAVYPPALYLPAILGWRIAESADLTIFNSLRLARLFGALTAVALGWLALRLCRCSRYVLLPFLLLPSTLFLNASCSQDAVLLAVAALIAAMLTRPLVARREFNHPELAAMALLLALCGTARPPYIALTLLLFVPGMERPRKPLRAWLPPFTAMVAVFATAGLWRQLVVPLGIESSDEANPEAQKLFLRTHPFAGGWAVLHGTGSAAVDFLHRGLYVLGWNDLLAPRGLVLLLAFAIAVILLLAPACPLRTWRARMLLLLSVAAPLFGISLAEYIIWTPPGLPTVYGIQPRYWLPLMPLAALLLQGRLPFTSIREKSRNVLLLSATAILFLIAATLPRTVAQAFYRQSISQVLRQNLR